MIVYGMPGIIFWPTAVNGYYFFCNSFFLFVIFYFLCNILLGGVERGWGGVRVGVGS